MEAVQAISMLNGQLYYDRKLSVRMDRVQDSKKGDTSAGSKLPAGLKGLGMGLGLNGSALTDVSSEYWQGLRLQSNDSFGKCSCLVALMMPTAVIGSFMDFYIIHGLILCLWRLKIRPNILMSYKYLMKINNKCIGL